MQPNNLISTPLLVKLIFVSLFAVFMTTPGLLLDICYRMSVARCRAGNRVMPDKTSIITDPASPKVSSRYKKHIPRHALYFAHCRTALAEAMRTCLN